MLLDLDVIIEIDPAELPVSVFVRSWRQRPERGPVELLVGCAPCRAPAAPGPILELTNPVSDRLVQFGQREEPLVAQPGQDPALHDLDANLDLGLVPGLVRARRNNRRA